MLPTKLNQPVEFRVRPNVLKQVYISFIVLFFFFMLIYYNQLSVYEQVNLRKAIADKYKENSFQNQFHHVSPNVLDSKNGRTTTNQKSMHDQISLTTISQEPVDVVYTWVNGSDPAFQQTLRLEKARIYQKHKGSNLKPLLKDENCHQVQSTRLVLIKSLNGDSISSLRMPTNTIELAFIEETKNFENSRLFAFPTEKLAQTYVEDTWQQHQPISASLAWLVFDCKIKNRPMAKYRWPDHLTLLHAVKVGRPSKDNSEDDRDNSTTVEQKLNVTLQNFESKLNSVGIKFVKLPTEKEAFASYAFPNQTDHEINEVNKIDEKTTDLQEIVKSFGFQLKYLELNVKTVDKYRLLSVSPESISENRFEDNDELRYSMRSLDKFAPWIRNVYIVTNGQIPSWLNTSHPKVRVVAHEEIFTNKSHLPNYNSAAIESHIHRIKGLSRYFLYFNDDMILAKQTFISDYLTDHGVHKVRLAWQVPPCATGCSKSWLGDGFCDQACNTTLCLFDGGDCLQDENKKKKSSTNVKAIPFKTGNSQSDWPKRLTEMGIFKQNPLAEQTLLRALERGKRVDECARDCNGSWLADGTCDPSCNNPACGHDLGDCDFENTKSVMQIKKFDSQSKQSTLNEYHFDDSKPVLALNFTDYMIKLVAANVTHHHNLSSDQNLTVITINASCLSPNVHTTVFDAQRKLLMLLISNQKFQGQLDVYLEVMLQGRLKWWNLQLIVNYNPIEEEETELLEPFQKKLLEKPIGAGRKLLDIYLDTLVHVDYLFNQHFKIISRKVPPHVPMLIDKQVMQRLQDTFQEEFEKTSSHRFRHSDDMQFSFSYYYFLMQEVRSVSAEETLHTMDTNQDGNLNRNEVRTLLTRLRKLPLKSHALNQYWQELIECTGNAANSKIQSLPIQQLIGCDDLVLQVETKFNQSMANQIEMLDDKEVAFRMIRGNVSQVEQQLDQLRAKLPHFICFNDDVMTDDIKVRSPVRKALHDFYDWLVPRPSQFELPNSHMSWNVNENDLQPESDEKITEPKKENQLQKNLSSESFGNSSRQLAASSSRFNIIGKTNKLIG